MNFLSRFRFERPVRMAFFKFKSSGSFHIAPPPRFLVYIGSLALLLNSCTSQALTPASSLTPTEALSAPSSPTPTPVEALSAPVSPTPTPAEATCPGPATDGGSSMFRADSRYSDKAGDMENSLLDVIGFETKIDEQSETLEVVLYMRDITPTVTLKQILDFAENMAGISVFLKLPSDGLENAALDFGFSVATTSGNENILTPVSGTETPVSIDQLWDDKIASNASGEALSELDVVADPDADTWTMRGHLPGITCRAVFGFFTFYSVDKMDMPDNFDPSVLTESQPSGVVVNAYPGPKHYEGDVLSFEIQGILETSDSVQMSLDGQDPTVVQGEWLFHGTLLLPLAFETANEVGSHQLTFSLGGVAADYSFDVLPSEQRPANEENASWKVTEIDCCVLHYITGTAAARDIDFIAEHFQTAADQLTVRYGATYEPKMQVHIVDRMVGNGGFGGVGQLAISYTDRYYGPLAGTEGLETLARHELSHAARIGLENVGDGIDFNYEGLAVYIAGGHYKPEPLAQRGAALYDLGYYVPVGRQIQQHELDYLYFAAMLTYIDEAYGKDKPLEFINADENPGDGQPTPLETAIQNTFGISLAQFDQDFQDWLESQDPGDQLDDLRLTVELQDLRRTYQDTYTPASSFLTYNFVEALARPEYLPIAMREADDPENIAIELIIAAGQKAIIDGDYNAAEEFVGVLEQILSSDTFEDPIAKDYLDIAAILSDQGYQVASLAIQGERATAQIIDQPPALVVVELLKVGGIWQIKP